MAGPGNDSALAPHDSPVSNSNANHLVAASGRGSGKRDSWHDTPSTSSAPASDQLTPDSGSDDDIAVVDNEGLLGAESYELQDRDPEKLRKAGSGAKLDDYEFDSDETSRAGASRRRASTSTTASFQLYTPDEERTVVRKFDRRLVVFVALLYLPSFLDRSSTDPSQIPRLPGCPFLFPPLFVLPLEVGAIPPFLLPLFLVRPGKGRG